MITKVPKDKRFIYHYTETQFGEKFTICLKDSPKAILIVGMVSLIQYYDDTDNSLYVHDLSVIKSFRKCKLGDMIMEHLIEICKMNDVKSLSLDYIEEWQKKWYEKIWVCAYRQ